MIRYRKVVRILGVGSAASELEKILSKESQPSFEVVCFAKVPRPEETSLFDALFLGSEEWGDWRPLRGMPAVAYCSDGKSAADALRHGMTETVLPGDMDARILRRIFLSAIERKEHEEQLTKTAGMNLDFLLFIAHEIRGPLAIVKEGVTLVGDKILGTVNAKQEKVLQTARRNIDRIDALIGGMLDISKLESGRMELRPEEFDWMELIKELAAHYSAEASAKGLELKVRSSATTLKVFGDRTRLKQVVEILISNALKFSPEGSVEISSALLKGDLCVVVADTGVGIEKDDQIRLFRKFSQIGWAPGGGQKGVGLGLAIAHGLVGLHGGTIEVRSEPKTGSAFTVRIPMRRNGAGAA